MLESQSGLWDADRAALGNLGRALGWSDVAYQHEHLDVALRDLEALTAEARLRLAKDGHLFQAMVGALGVMVVILML
jgi:stage III sporulation protein AB